MTTATNLRWAAAILSCATGIACGSSSGTPGDGGAPDTGAAIGGGTMTWKEGGTAHTAQIATASIVRNSQLDYLQLGGGQASVAVAMGVAVNPPPLAAGSFVCGGTGYPIVSFSYTGSDGSNLTCTLDLTMVGLATGVHAVGTFSATFGVTGGGTKSVTDGRFDIPLIVTGP